MSNDVVPDALLRFLHGETEPATFHHADHVRMAFEILSRHTDFLTAAQHYSRALKTMTKRIGAPAAYHETITLGFLALIGERMAEAGYANNTSRTRTPIFWRKTRWSVGTIALSFALLSRVGRLCCRCEKLRER